MLAAAGSAVSEGARVVALVAPVWWPRRGELAFRAAVVRAVGLGELMARLDHLRRVLAAEGLFAAERKRPLPFLPRRVGLVSGRASAAMTDVVENARVRWPAVEFEVREVVVQGAGAVPAVMAAVRELDADPGVDVIVVARGGGSFEDLLPFSDEGLVRAVAACATPVVSAIGHEEDSPILDLVADVRASTPTDAARRVVPDVGEQAEQVRRLRQRMQQRVVAALDREQHRLTATREHPGLRDPGTVLDRRHGDVLAARRTAWREVSHRLVQRQTEVAGLTARLRTLSPQATLERGYAVVRTTTGTVVRDAGTVTAGERLSVRVASGSFDTVVATSP